MSRLKEKPIQRPVSFVSLLFLFLGLVGAIPAPVAWGGEQDFSVSAVLHHEEALNRPHDIEVQGRLAFVAGKGGSVAIVDVADLEAPKLLWWKRNRKELDNAQTVLPLGDHLFLGGEHFFSIAIGNPAQPVFRKQVSDRPRIARINGMVHRGDFIFSANKNGWVSVFDISEPGSPTLVDALNARKRGKLTSPHDIDVYGDFLVVVSQGHRSPDKLRLYRMADEENHQLLPCEEWTIAGAIRRADLNGANRVVVSGHHAFVACSQSRPDNYTIGFIDIGHPSEPVHLKTVPFAGSHATGLTVSGRVLFAAGGKTIQAFDISDPSNPETLAVFKSEEVFPTGRDNAHDLVYRDGYLFVTAQNDEQIGIVKVLNKRVRSLAQP